MYLLNYNSAAFSLDGAIVQPYDTLEYVPYYHRRALPRCLALENHLDLLRMLPPKNEMLPQWQQHTRFGSSRIVAILVMALLAVLHSNTREVHADISTHDTANDPSGQAAPLLAPFLGHEHFDQAEVVHHVQIWTHSDTDNEVPSDVDATLPHGREVRVSTVQYNDMRSPTMKLWKGI